MNIYKCFGTGASQSKHNMCGSRNFYQGGGVQTRRQENSVDSVFLFVCLFCVVLNLLTEGFQCFYFREGLSYEDFSDIPMFQDWGQSTLKLHV